MNERFSFAIATRLLIRALGLISIFFVARYMGAEVLGTIAFAVSYIKLFQQFSDLGFGGAHIKRVSEGKDLGICNGTYFSVKIVLTGLMILIVLISVIVPKYVFHSDAFSTEQEIVIYIILFSVIFDNLGMMFNTTFSARKEIAKMSFAELSNKIITVGFKLFVIFAGLGIFWLASANIVGTITWFLLLLFFFRNYPVKKPTVEYFKSYFKLALPIVFIGFLTKYSENLDKVMIGYFSSATDVGFYSAGQTVVQVMVIFIYTSNSLIFPTISKLHSENDLVGIRKLSNKVEKYFSLFLFPIAVILTIFSEIISYNLFGNEFLQVTPDIISISIWFIVISALMNPYMAQFVATNNVKLGAKISASYLLLGIFLNIVFIPDEILGIKTLGFGAIGAAWATLISAFIGSIVYRFYANKITGSKPSSAVIKHIISAMIMFYVLRILNVEYVDSYNPILPLIFSFLGLLIYSSLLILFKELTIVELKYLISFINFKKISVYAKNEIKKDK